MVPGSDGGTSWWVGRRYIYSLLHRMLTFPIEGSDIPAEHQLSREASEDVPTSAASLELVVGHLWLWRLLGSVALNAVVTAVA